MSGKAPLKSQKNPTILCYLPGIAAAKKLLRLGPDIEGCKEGQESKKCYTGTGKWVWMP